MVDENMKPKDTEYLETSPTVMVGLDDGNAQTKIAFTRDTANIETAMCPSSGAIGKVHRSAVFGTDKGPDIAEFTTDGEVFTVGAIPSPEDTTYDGHQWSPLNRTISHHLMLNSGLEGKTVDLVVSLPFSLYYLEDGSVNEEVVRKKEQSYLKPVIPNDGRKPITVRSVEVLPEGLAGYFTYIIPKYTIIDDMRQEDVVAIDIGGRTTEFVAVSGMAVDHRFSGSFEVGALDIRKELEKEIRTRFQIPSMTVISAERISKAIENRVYRIRGENHNISEEIARARTKFVSRLHKETERRIGDAFNFDQILLFGGGVLDLSDELFNWFSHATQLDQPEMVNALGLLKYGVVALLPNGNEA